MKKCIWIQAVIFLLLSAASAFCQTGPAEDRIPQEEYGIYRLVLQKLGGCSFMGRETLDGVRADFDALLPPARMTLPPDLVKDFNEKNLETHNLSDSFVQETVQGSGVIREGRKKITFSRVGFDGERRRALLVIGMAWYYREDVMNEGKFVLLEKNDGKWAIVDTITAWPMHLGPVR